MTNAAPPVSPVKQDGENITAQSWALVLGLAFVIPLRKQMIDFNRLAYPGGIAVATILKSPGAGVRKAIILLAAALMEKMRNGTVIKRIIVFFPSVEMIQKNNSRIISSLLIIYLNLI